MEQVSSSIGGHFVVFTSQISEEMYIWGKPSIVAAPLGNFHLWGHQIFIKKLNESVSIQFKLQFHCIVLSFSHEKLT